MQQAYLVHRLFRRIDPTGDGKVTREEWLAFFRKGGRQQDHLVTEDLRERHAGWNVPDRSSPAMHPRKTC